MDDDTRKVTDLKEKLENGYKTLTIALEDIKEQLDLLKKKQEQWDELVDKMKKCSEAAENKITFDVGGKIFSTSKETLLEIPNTYFFALISSDVWKPDKNGVYFIDRDPKYFKIILNYLRIKKIDYESLSDFEIKLLKKELDYFQINVPVIIEYEQLFMKWIDASEFELIYKATVDGFEASKFHSKCDGKGKTITIIYVNNDYVFGGYTLVPWGTSNRYQRDSSAFIFALKNPNISKPVKFNISNINKSVYHHINCGPTFGGVYNKPLGTISFNGHNNEQHDIYISDNSDQNSLSYSSFPNSYDSGGYDIRLAGSKMFKVSEIEVYLVT